MRRRSLHAVETTRSARRSSSSPTGASLARRRFPKATSSASLSPLSRHSRLSNPCLVPLRATTALPAGVRGPVLFCAFCRFASACRSLVIAPRICDGCVRRTLTFHYPAPPHQVRTHLRNSIPMAGLAKQFGGSLNFFVVHVLA